MLTIGGISFEEDRKKYRGQPCHIVISTVGRLWEMLSQHVLILDRQVTVVLDEGDKLLSNKDDKLNKVFSLMGSVSRRWLIYSATYSPSIVQDILRIAKTKGKERVEGEII